jgi:hypothetical protein
VLDARLLCAPNAHRAPRLLFCLGEPPLVAAHDRQRGRGVPADPAVHEPCLAERLIRGLGVFARGRQASALGGDERKGR